MRRFIALTAFVLFCDLLSAQQDASSRHPKYVIEDDDTVIYVGSARPPGVLPKNLVYFEAGGTAHLYSVNYARLFHANRIHGAARIGFEYFQGDEHGFAIPFEASGLVGREKNFFEFGVGVTGFSKKVFHRMSPGGSSFGYSDYYTQEEGSIISIRLGYCGIFPIAKGSLLIRAALTPLLIPYNYDDEYDFRTTYTFPYGLWAGLSFGYAF
jgi:hypothetical protein